MNAGSPLTALSGGACVALCLAMSGAPCPALAQESWTPGGVSVATASADRVFPVAVPDGAGGAFLAWQEYARIRLQRLTAEGTAAPEWSAATGREVCATSGAGGYEQSSPRAVSDEAGGVYVIWHDERNTGCSRLCLGEPKQIFVQRFGPDGSLAPGWPEHGVSAGSWLSRMSPTPGGTRGYPGEMNTVVASDGRRGLLIAWVEQAIRGNTIPGLRVQRIGPRGERLWGERGVLLCAAPGVPQFPSVISDRSGGAFVVWQDLRDAGEGSRLYHQRVSAGGVPLLAANGARVTSGTEPNERFPRIVESARDAALVVWEAGPEAPASALYCRVVPTGRLPRPLPEYRLTDSALPGGDLAVMPDPRAGTWVAWVDVRSETGRDIYMQRLLRSGKPAPGWPRDGAPVVTVDCADRSRPMLAADGANGAFVGWRDAAEPRLSRLTPHGRVARGWPAAGLALTTEPGVDRGLDLISDGRGAAIGVWDQWLTQRGVDDVRAQRVERGRWLPRRPVRPLPASEEVADGRAAPSFALFGLRPNPSIGPSSVAFALPTAEPATLELFDVTGRRLARHDVGRLGAGRHLVRLETGSRLAPGVYLIRLAQGERQVTIRGVVAR